MKISLSNVKVMATPLAGKRRQRKKMYKYEELQQAADNGLLSRDLFSVFIRDHKAGALGNTLAHCGIIAWEVKTEEYEPAIGWWKSERELTINWDEILNICDAYSDDRPPRLRNFGSAKRVKLQEYFGIAAMKRPRSKRPICPHCGQRYSPENDQGEAQPPEKIYKYTYEDLKLCKTKLEILNLQ